MATITIGGKSYIAGSPEATNALFAQARSMGLSAPAPVPTTQPQTRTLSTSTTTQSPVISTQSSTYSPAPRTLTPPTPPQYQAPAFNASSIMSGQNTNAGVDAFNTAILQLLKKQQSLGTKGFAEQGFNAQQEQVNRTQATDPSMIGASPGQQSAVRNASVGAVQPTVNSAANSQQTFGEQIRSMGDAINSARAFSMDYSNRQSQSKADAQNIINMAVQLGGAAGLESVKQANPEIFKVAGMDEATLISTAKAKEKYERELAQYEMDMDNYRYETNRQDQQANQQQYNTVDLGDRVAFYDNQGTLIKTEKKGLSPSSTSSSSGFDTNTPGINPSTGSRYTFDTPDAIASLPISNLAKAVILGTADTKSFTPTAKQEIAAELYKVGFNPYEQINRKLDSLLESYKNVDSSYLGLVQGYVPGRFNPTAAEFDSERTLLTREVARLRDVGVLSDQDVASYNAAMPARTDRNYEVAAAKVAGIKSSVSGGILGGGTTAPAGGRVTVKSPTGQVGTIPSEQLSEAIRQGYTLVK